MEGIGALIGGLAALPQVVQSASDLYALRSRYKDASVLITSIYSESLTIAASLSQIQHLLQHDGLQSKPQLLQTFDQALTGCRVVYVCLEEEVQELVAKAKSDDLKFKDRAKFLWKEDTFKELLTQIRGQQSALNLLIQGLQMESIADIKKLVEDNSVTLDRVVKRSRTLRQSHPRIKVPESIFSQSSRVENGPDTGPTVDSTEFAFDDEIVNSKTYRRAMASALATHLQVKTPDSSETELLKDESTVLEPPLQISQEINCAETTKPALSPVEDGVAYTETEAKQISPSQTPADEEHQDLFDTLERDILAFMPRITSTAPHLNPYPVAARADPRGTNALTPAPLRSYSAEFQVPMLEAAPPLPPRRPSEQHVLPNAPIAITSKPRSASSDDSVYTSEAPSILSKVSTASSYTLCEASQSSSILSKTPKRKPLPLASQSSYGALNNIRTGSFELSLPNTASLQNSEMQNIWISLVDAERKFVDRMVKLKRLFYDNVVRQWPMLEKHLGAILVGEQLATVHQQCLLQLMDQQLAGNGNLCDPYIFDAWIGKSQQLYREYSRTMPHAYSSLHTTQQVDPKFTPFVNTLGLSIVYFGKSWEDYLRLPILQLQTYADSLESLVKIAETLAEPAEKQETQRLRHVLQAVTWLKTSTSISVEGAQAREDIQNLEKQIRVDTATLSQLRLHESTRRLKYRGNMAMKIKSQGPWIAVHVLLLDNFLLWGKIKKSKVDEAPILDSLIAVGDLEFALPPDVHQFEKSTMLDQIPRGSTLYTITIKDKTAKGKPSLLGCYGFQERRTCYDHLTAAINSLQK